VSSTLDVIACFDVHPTDHQFYQEAFGPKWDVRVTDKVLSDETAHLADDAAVISIHVSSPVTAAFMERMHNLKHVACRTTGYDNVDLEYAKSHGITVSTVPGYGEDTVAEYAFMMLLAVCRRLMRAAHSVHAGMLAPEKLTGHDLFGKTLGVIGTGRIGRKAAAIGRGFGMTVLAYDPYPNQEAASQVGYRYVSLDELLRSSDALTLHAPATPDTRHMLNADTFAVMKPGVFIVNTGRGSLIDTPALIDALTAGKVGGAGLDVLEGEEYLHQSPEVHLADKKAISEEAKTILGIDTLAKMPNVLITSHNAYNSVEALDRIRQTTVQNVLAWKMGSHQNLIV
jgi:D-lactate dehydrogenase